MTRLCHAAQALPRGAAWQARIVALQRGSVWGWLVASVSFCFLLCVYALQQAMLQVAELLAELVETAEAVAAAMEAHTRREERSLLPQLQRCLGSDAKRTLVRQTLQVRHCILHKSYC